MFLPLLVLIISYIILFIRIKNKYFYSGFMKILSIILALPGIIIIASFILIEEIILSLLSGINFLFAKISKKKNFFFSLQINMTLSILETLKNYIEDIKLIKILSAIECKNNFYDLANIELFLRFLKKIIFDKNTTNEILETEINTFVEEINDGKTVLEWYEKKFGGDDFCSFI